MTIVVWDGKTLAVDKLIYNDGLGWKGDKAWLVKPKGGDTEHIVSGVGISSYIVILREWYREGAVIADYPYATTDTHSLIVVKKDGLYEYNATPYPECYGLKDKVFGSGQNIAIGALAMGADAKKAVEIVNKHSVYCGYGVATYGIPT